MHTLNCRVHGEVSEENLMLCKDIHNLHGIKKKCRLCYDEKKQKTLEKHIANGFIKPDKIEGKCRKHGELDENTGFICVDPMLLKGYRIRCKECTHTIRSIT